jgi:hypothetical protein
VPVAIATRIARCLPVIASPMALPASR